MSPGIVSLDKAYDNRRSREAAVGRGRCAAHPADRRGEEGVRPVEGPQAASVGGGTDIRLVVEVPRAAGAVREEGRQLFWPDPDGVRAALVSASPPDGKM